MANGQLFEPENLTCASWFYPLGTVVKVTHNELTVSVVVTDRGPAKRLVSKGRTLDLSKGAWDALKLDPKQGLATVKINP